MFPFAGQINLKMLNVMLDKHSYFLVIGHSESLLILEQAYDSQTGYDFPYFRPAVDEAMRGQGLPTPQEVGF